MGSGNSLSLNEKEKALFIMDKAFFFENSIDTYSKIVKHFCGMTCIIRKYYEN